MKKNAKIILSCMLGAMVLGGCSNSNNNLSGTVVTNLQEGTGEYDWRKHDVHIKINNSWSGVYETNCDDDNIYDVRFNGYSYTDDPTFSTKYGAYISYEQDFSLFDDLEVVFVLTNGSDTYTSELSECDTPWGSQEVDLPASFYKGDYYISEIWVRTVD